MELSQALRGWVGCWDPSCWLPPRQFPSRVVAFYPSTTTERTVLTLMMHRTRDLPAVYPARKWRPLQVGTGHKGRGQNVTRGTHTAFVSRYATTHRMHLDSSVRFLHDGFSSHEARQVFVPAESGENRRSGGSSRLEVQHAVALEVEMPRQGPYPEPAGCSARCIKYWPGDSEMVRSFH